MAERIKIAELEIDDKALIKSTSDIKKQINILKEAQKELTKEGQTASKEYVKNASDLKVLSSAYNQNIKALSQRTQATADATNREQLLDIVLKEQVNTVAEAREQNKLLNKLRNETNVTTAQGQKELKALNNALDQNNEFIKENVDAYTQQKINVGNYKDSIKEAFNELNIFNGGLGGFIARSKEAGGVGSLVTSSLKGMAQGFLGMTKAALAFIATPIGAVLAAIVAAFALVRNAMNRSEESTNKIRKAFSAFSGIIDTLLKTLKPLGEFLINGLVKSFELVEKGIYKALDAIASGLEFLGFDETAASLKAFNQEVQQGAADAKALAEAEAELEKQQRSSQRIQLEYQKNAEKLRQIRDDENLTIKERITANDELGKVLQEQLTEELKIAELALQVANARIQSEGQTKEALDAQAEALTTIADIEERIEGQRSEQLTNRVALQKEAADKAREIADKAIEQQRAELDLFIEQQGVRAKTLEESLQIAEDVYKREVEILDAELKNRNITQTEYDAQLLQLKNDLSKQYAEAASENAQRELDAYIQANQSKLDSDVYFSDESLRIEQERLNGIAEKRREFAETQLNEGIINQQQYNDAINAINEENRIALEEAQTEREEAQKEKDLIDLENKRAIQEENFLTDFEIQAQRLEQQRQQEVEAAEKSGADISLINQKYAERKKQLDADVEQAKIQGLASTFGNVAEIAGKQTAVGKAAAVAEATINTYQAATAAYSAMAGIPIIGPALGAVAAAAAVVAGLANVKKIVSTKTKYAQGGIAEIQGPRHSGGGVPIYAGSQYIGEAEGGEGIGILRRSAFDGFMDFNNNHKGGSSYRGFMAGGGIITSAVSGSNSSRDVKSLESALSEMKIYTTVEDINRESGKYAQVVSGGNL